MSKIRIGLVGARGHTGAELIRLIAAHPAFELAYVTSRELAGQALAEHSPSYADGLRYCNPAHEELPALGADAVLLGRAFIYALAAAGEAGVANLLALFASEMRVAMALISTMVFLGGIYGLLGVHFIAAFQVLIYVGAVMVFMVYVIMLLEVRDATGAKYSTLLLPGIAGFVLVMGVIVIGIQAVSPSGRSAR